MKKITVLMCIFFALQSNISAQTDSIFLKNGKKIIGKFTISSEKDILYNEKNSIEYNLDGIERVTINNNHWQPVEFYNNGLSKLYLAQLIYKNEISLLELITKQDGFSVEKYFFLKNNKIILINEKNLAVFYPVYFGDKYNKSQNKNNMHYNYFDIINILNNCLGIIDKDLINRKRKYVYNNLLGINIGLINQSFKPKGQNYFGYEAFNLKLNAKNISFGFNHHIEFNHKIMLNSQLNYQKLHFDINPNDTLSYSGYSALLGYTVTKIYRGDFSKSSLTFNIQLGRTFSINPNFSLDLGLGFDLNRTLKQKDASNATIRLVTTNDVYKSVDIRIINFNSIKDSKERFGVSGGGMLKYQFSQSQYGIGLFANYTLTSQQASIYDAFYNSVYGSYFSGGFMLYKKI